MAVAERLSRQSSATARSVAERLNEALADLTRSAAAGKPHGAVTAAALCRRVGVSRNSLYRYHPKVLEALRGLRRQQPSRARSVWRAVIYVWN